MRARSLGLLPLLFGWALGVSAAPDVPKPAELIGTWHGTSVCTDRVAAPACHDEVVVYEFTAGEKPGTVRWQADKIVDGERASMGDSQPMSYDPGKKCWAAELQTPRFHIVWCLVVEGAHLTGTGRLLPGKETVRKVDLRKD
jgi:hypothetical protein